MLYIAVVVDMSMLERRFSNSSVVCTEQLNFPLLVQHMHTVLDTNGRVSRFILSVHLRGDTPAPKVLEILLKRALQAAASDEEVSHKQLLDPPQMRVWLTKSLRSPRSGSWCVAESSHKRRG